VLRVERWRGRGALLRGLLAAPIVASVLAALDPGAACADEAALRARIAELREPAEAAGAADLLEHASRALVEAARRRGLGERAAAERAVAIAEAAFRAADRRVAALRARGDRDAARARIAALETRARQAREALARARAEKARLGGGAGARPDAPGSGENAEAVPEAE
jgi:hypothetical protein